MIAPLKTVIPDSTSATDLRRVATAATALIAPQRGQPIGEVLARPQQRLKHKTDREDPRAQQREVISLQMRISDVVAGIKAYASDYRSQGQAASKEQLMTSLERLNADINVQLNPDTNSHQEIREQNDLVREELKNIQARFLELGKDANHNQEKADLNLRAIEAYRYLIKTQVKLAQLKLQNTSRPLFDSQTAIQLLHNADRSADLLVRELNWRKNRLQAGSKIREMETLDFLGQTIWSTSLANFDISVKSGTTTIRQKIWINPHTRLGSIMKDLKASDISTARDKIQDLISLYSSPLAPALTSSNADFLKQLRELDQHVEQQSNSISDANVLEGIKQKVKTLQALIPDDQSHPIQKDITFSKDEAAGLRSRVHILQGNYDDFIEVAKTLAHMEDLSLLLTMAAKRQLLSKSNKVIVDQDLEQLIAWITRGKVYPKQFAKAYLQHIPDIVNKGFEAQRSDSITDQGTKQYELAATEIRKAADMLRPRLADLVNISKGTKSKLDAIYTELKDTDIQGRASLITNLFNEEKYAETLEQIQTIKSQYFTFLFPEPGYIRASQSLNKLEDCVRRAVRHGGTKLQAEVKYLSDLIIADIEHKNQLRLTVVDFDEESPYKKYVFPNQHITPFGLTKWLQKQFLSTGNGWKSLNDLSKNDELSDLNKRNILLASQLPSKMKTIAKSLPVIAA